jgi:hypothetical protein
MQFQESLTGYPRNVNSPNSREDAAKEIYSHEEVWTSDSENIELKHGGVLPSKLGWTANLTRKEARDGEGII